ncbi:hypothetical protein E3N88_37017 [Mikania micrantha]|uniref:Uncharacterized protein n=1 Tax=Mikania micrantha TaxID=192012 RepID=A0A5N6M5K1_9ASTR|nr:hypothetical protein E3N88_37017 [Mikania micrantha]
MLTWILQQSDGYIDIGEPEIRNCEIKLFCGCGAGFSGDRPLAALKLLQKVKDLNYLVLECLAERTLADRYQAVMSGGDGYDPRISEWMQLLLPLAVDRGVCIITNMGATNALAAQEKVLEIASKLGVRITVGVAYQFDIAKAGLGSNLRNANDGISIYLGAAPIVECLEKYNPNVIITSRVADAALFLAPMVYELGWNWDEFLLLAQGSLAGHLLECGCHPHWRIFMHPGAKPAATSVPENLLALASKDAGWKGWGEISYVKSWMEEVYPVTKDIRLRMDGLFEGRKHAIEFTKEFIALYTNGPSGGGGISTGHKKEILLEKGLVGREHIYWKISAKQNQPTKSNDQINILPTETNSNHLTEFLPPEIHLSPAPSNQKVHLYEIAHSRAGDKSNDINFSVIPHFPPDIKRLKTVIKPDWVKRVISPLLNQSSFPEIDDIEMRDKWVAEHVNVEVYEVRGISSLNVVVRNVLDGGVNCSRRIDRHGKTISDLILCQEVVLPM